MTKAIFTARNLHALTVMLPARTASHFNRISCSALSVETGEHRHFEQADRTYVMLALPAVPLPKRKFLEEYQELVIRVDGSMDIRLSDYARLFSHSLEDTTAIRGVPTFVPLSEFGYDFIGQAHDFELLRSGKLLFGSVRWLVPDERTGPIVASVEPGSGHGEVMIRCEKVDFKLASVVLYIDASFGDPVSVEQVLPDGTRHPLSYLPVGVDMVGDKSIFREAYVEGFRTGFARELAILLKFNRSGEGYFAAVGQTVTRFKANQIVQVP